MHVDSSYSRTQDPDKVLRDFLEHGHYRGLMRQHKLHWSVWPPMEAWTTDINMTSGYIIDHRHLHAISGCNMAMGINTDPCHSKTKIPHVALGGNKLSVVIQT